MDRDLHVFSSKATACDYGALDLCCRLPDGSHAWWPARGLEHIMGRGFKRVFVSSNVNAATVSHVKQAIARGEIFVSVGAVQRVS